MLAQRRAAPEGRWGGLKSRNKRPHGSGAGNFGLPSGLNTRKWTYEEPGRPCVVWDDIPEPGARRQVLTELLLHQARAHDQGLVLGMGESNQTCTEKEPIDGCLSHPETAACRRLAGG